MKKGQSALDGWIEARQERTARKGRKPVVIRMPPAKGFRDEAEAREFEWTRVKPSVAVSVSNFEKSDLKRPLGDLEIFVMCVDSGVVPPRMAMERLAAGFRRWMESEGELDLETALKLKRGRGRDPALVREKKERRNMKAMFRFGCLLGIGATQAQAAEMVAASTGTLGPDTLLAYWQRMKPEGRSFFSALGSDLSKDPEQVIKMLARFPLHVAPDFMPSERKHAISIHGQPPG